MCEGMSLEMGPLRGGPRVGAGYCDFIFIIKKAELKPVSVFCVPSRQASELEFFSWVITTLLHLCTGAELASPGQGRKGGERGAPSP